MVVKKIHFRATKVPKLSQVGKTYAQQTFFSKISNFQNFFLSNSRVMVTPKCDQISDDCDQLRPNESTFKKKNFKNGRKNFFLQNGPRAARGRTTMIHDIPIIYRYFLGTFVKFRDFAIPDFGIGQKKSDS